MKIVVVGSLGHIGKPLTQELVKRGHSVTVISSNADRQKDIEALGATAAIGSVTDVAFLTETFTRADAVHAMVPPAAGAGMGDIVAAGKSIGQNFAKAIEQSLVKRVLYVSSYGAHLEHGVGPIAAHYYIEQALNAIPGMQAVTHLRATYIYYNLLAFIGTIRAAGFIAANYGGDDRVVLVSPIDIAAAAVDELEHQAPGHRVRYVASDERTCNEIAQALGNAIGKPDLQWHTISDEDLQKGYESFGVPAAIAAGLVEMFHACHTGLLHEDYDLHRPATLGKVKIEDYAREFAADFNQK